jgi:hypothetical protein
VSDIVRIKKVSIATLPPPGIDLIEWQAFPQALFVILFERQPVLALRVAFFAAGH